MSVCTEDSWRDYLLDSPEELITLIWIYSCLKKQQKNNNNNKKHTSVFTNESLFRFFFFPIIMKQLYIDNDSC